MGAPDPIEYISFHKTPWMMEEHFFILRKVKAKIGFGTNFL